MKLTQSTFWYFANDELFFLREEVEIGEQPPPDQKILTRLIICFAADYSCPKEHLDDKEAIGAYSRNVGFHVWPYWREAVHAFTLRMCLPPITIPVMRPPAGSLSSESNAQRNMGWQVTKLKNRYPLSKAA